MDLVEMVMDGRLNGLTVTNASCSKAFAVGGQTTMRTVEVVKRNYHADLAKQMTVPKTLDGLGADQVDYPRDTDAHCHCRSES